jgi:uncharacterized protein YuzE
MAFEPDIGGVSSGSPALLSRDRQSLHRICGSPCAETREIADGLNVDFDADGGIVGLDIDGASKKLDLTTIETVALPIKATRAA